MTDDNLAEAHAAWISTVVEDVLEPELPILDPHHHLWLDRGHTGWPYTLEDLHSDTGSGHNVVGTVFLECRAQYRTDGPHRATSDGEDPKLEVQVPRRLLPLSRSIEHVSQLAHPLPLPSVRL